MKKVGSLPTCDAELELRRALVCFGLKRRARPSTSLCPFLGVFFGVLNMAYSARINDGARGESSHLKPSGSVPYDLGSPTSGRGQSIRCGCE